MSTRELQQRLIENMREWQKLENAQVALADSVLEKTGNPFVAVVMQMIQRDSHVHHRVQQLFIDSLESEVVAIEPQDAQLLQDRLAAHLKMEEETLRLAEESLAALKGQGFLVQEFLLDFLRRDEQKHRSLLVSLDPLLAPQEPEDGA